MTSEQKITEMFDGFKPHFDRWLYYYDRMIDNQSVWREVMSRMYQYAIDNEIKFIGNYQDVFDSVEERLFSKPNTVKSASPKRNHKKDNQDGVPYEMLAGKIKKVDRRMQRQTAIDTIQNMSSTEVVRAYRYSLSGKGANKIINEAIKEYYDNNEVIASADTSMADVSIVSDSPKKSENGDFVYELMTKIKDIKGSDDIIEDKNKTIGQLNENLKVLKKEGDDIIEQYGNEIALLSDENNNLRYDNDSLKEQVASLATSVQELTAAATPKEADEGIFALDEMLQGMMKDIMDDDTEQSLHHLIYANEGFRDTPEYKAFRDKVAREYYRRMPNSGNKPSSFDGEGLFTKDKRSASKGGKIGFYRSKAGERFLSSFDKTYDTAATMVRLEKELAKVTEEKEQQGQELRGELERREAALEERIEELKQEHEKDMLELGQKYIEEMEQDAIGYQEELERLKNKGAMTEGQARELGRQLVDIQKKLDEQRATSTRMANQMEANEARYMEEKQQLENQINLKEEELERYRNNIVTADDELERVKEEREELNEEIKAKNEEIENLRAKERELEQIKNERDDMEKELEEKEEEIERLRNDLSLANQEQDNIREEAEEASQQEIMDRDDEIAELVEQINERENQVNNMREQLFAADIRADELQAVIAANNEALQEAERQRVQREREEEANRQNAFMELQQQQLTSNNEIVSQIRQLNASAHVQKMTMTYVIADVRQAHHISFSDYVQTEMFHLSKQYNKKVSVRFKIIFDTKTELVTEEDHALIRLDLGFFGEAYPDNDLPPEENPIVEDPEDNMEHHDPNEIELYRFFPFRGHCQDLVSYVVNFCNPLVEDINRVLEENNIARRVDLNYILDQNQLIYNNRVVFRQNNGISFIYFTENLERIFLRQPFYNYDSRSIYWYLSHGNKTLIQDDGMSTLISVLNNPQANANYILESDILIQILPEVFNYGFTITAVDDRNRMYRDFFPYKVEMLLSF